MAFKNTCILLLVSVVFLLGQAKHVHKDTSHQKGKYGIFRQKKAKTIIIYLSFELSSRVSIFNFHGG